MEHSHDIPTITGNGQSHELEISMRAIERDCTGNTPLDEYFRTEVISWIKETLAMRKNRFKGSQDQRKTATI